MQVTFPTIYFTPFLIFTNWGSSDVEPVLVPKIENTYYSRCVYTLGHKFHYSKLR